MFHDLTGIDLHYHANPDAYIRKYHAIEAGQYYQNRKYGVVLRSHLGSTVEVASLCQAMGLPVFGSINLNKINGGISYKNVMRALAANTSNTEYRIIVDLPTFRKSSHKSKLARQLSNPAYAKFALLKEDIIFSGKLKSSLIDLIKFARDYPIVISTGHASREEVYLILEEAEKAGLSRVIINQPANPMTGLYYKDLIELAKYSFVYFEQTLLTILLNYQPEEDFSLVINQLPRVFYSSDLGQRDQLSIMEWFENSQSLFDLYNVSTKRKEEVCLKNPLDLLRV
jgi:hypothetical protein